MPGVVYCFVDGCRSKLKERPFFRCPKDKIRCETWKNVLGFKGNHRYANITLEQCYTRIRVCNLHFTDNSFTNELNNRINWSAIPSLFLQRTEDNDEYIDVPNNACSDVPIKVCSDVSIQTTSAQIGGVEECKKKWSSVRDQLRRTIQKRKRTSGQGAVKIRKYKYEDTLDFLIPHILERDTPSNVINYEEHQNDEMETTYVDNPEELDERTCQLSNNEDDKSGIEFENHNIDSMDNTLKFTTETSASSSSFPVKTIQPTLKRKMNREGPGDSPAGQLLAYILAEKEEIKRMKTEVENTVKHPVDAFLDGIAPTLKALDPIQLNQAKSAIFNIVQDFEMRQLEHSSFDIKLSPPSSPQFDLAP